MIKPVLVWGLRWLLNFTNFVCSGRITHPAELSDLAIYTQALALILSSKKPKLLK
jgi:hypothetical protein|tara:strand:+ start:42643 stop:42807 length:165 start_codon:yes stop_codon:yes gene_type:complete